MSFFDYLGSAVTYAAVGAAILWTSVADGMTDAEVAGLVSKGLWSSMAIIGNMSRLLDCAEALTDLGGYASRVSQMLEVLEMLKEDAGVGKEETFSSHHVDVAGVVSDKMARSGGGSGDEVMTVAVPPTSSVSYSPHGSTSGEGVLVSVDGLSLRVPDGRWLIHDLSFKVSWVGP